MGGITRLREIAPYVRRAGLRVSPHIFGLVHAQIFSGLGMHDVPIEWSIPGTGVDPYGESLQQPVCVHGSIDPFPPQFDLPPHDP